MILNLPVVRLAITAVAIFVLIFVLILVLILGGASVRSQQPLDADTTIETLVKRLGSEKFIERQRASKLLFEKGADVVAELESVPLSSNPEVNQRIGDLVKLLSAGSEAIENKETFDAIINFENAELETRKQLLEKLLSGEQYEMFFHMIEKMPADQAEDIFSKSRLRHLMPVLCEKERWQDIDYILSHPLTWKHEPNLCGLYHKTMGTLDIYIDKMKRAIDDSEIADANQLTTLIGLLKSQKKYDTALRYAQRYSNSDLIVAYENQILMQAGDWKELADRAVLSDDPIDSDRYFICNRMTYPMVKYWGGTEDEFREAIDRVTEKSIAEEEQKGGDDEEDGNDGKDEIEGFGEDLEEAETFVVDPILQQIYLLTLDWEEAQKGIKITKSKSSAELLDTINKYDLLFDELSLGHDFASHQKWAQKKQADIAKLTDKLARRSGRENQNDLMSEVNVELEYYLTICDLFAVLGLEREAILFVRQLYEQMHTVDAMPTTRLDLIGHVADYGDAEALWDFIEHAGLSNVQLNWLVEAERPLGGRTVDKQFVLFGLKHEVALFVYQKLSSKFDDRIELLKRVAQIVNYQLKPSPVESENDAQASSEPFSLDANVALIEHSFGSDDCWKISQIYAYHQRPEFEQWRQRAAINGDVRAIKQIANELFDEHDYLGAAAMFEQEFQRTESPLPLSQAAQSYGLAGNALKEKRFNFHAYVLPAFLYDNNLQETFSAYLEDDRTDLIADLLLYRISTSSFAAQNVLTHYGWHILEKPDPIAASNFSKIRLLASSIGYSTEHTLKLAVLAHTLDATASVVAGDYLRADRVLKRLLDFLPASPSVAEKTVVKLDLAGETERADAVIDRLKTCYHQLLIEFPTSSTHCNNYAWVLACGKRHADAAIRHAQIAVQRRPNSPGFIDTLAESYFAAGDIEKAIKTINHAASIEPEKTYYKNQRKRYEAGRR